MPMVWIRRAAWALVGVAALVFAGLLSGLIPIANDRPRSPPYAHDIGGSFTLVDHTGRPVTERDFAGRLHLVFFGFTHCPDVCPMALGLMADVMYKLGLDAERLAVLFITVDPERDTPAVLADYLSAFDRRVIGLTGTPEQIRAVAQAWRAYYRKVPRGNGDYTMDHTATIYLHDAAGRFRSTIDLHDTTGSELEKVRGILNAPD